MRFTTFATLASIASYAVAKDVVCLVNDTPVATVDLDSGVCPFTVPNASPKFDFESLEDYDVTFYYAIAETIRYFSDIVNAGDVIEIPASALYGAPATPVFEFSDSKTPAANSTAALRRRLLGKTVYSRDEESDFLASIKEAEGTEIEGSTFAVVDVSDVSSDVVSTATSTGHVTVTITSCSDNKCTEIPAIETMTTETVDDVVTSYTTYCPLSELETETETSHTTVTITSCEDDKCTEIPAVETMTTETVEGVVTSYTTYCPLSELESESYETTSTLYVTSFVTITSCGADGCKPMVESVTTTTVNGVETIYTTLCPIEEATTTSEAAVESSVETAVESETVTETESCSETVSTSEEAVATSEEAVATTSEATTSEATTPVVTPAPYPVNGTSTTVCNGEDCDITMTVDETVTLSVYASTSKASNGTDVSVVEGAASSVGALTSVVALVVAALLL